MPVIQKNILLIVLMFSSFFSFSQRNTDDGKEIVQQRIEFISEQLENENIDLTALVEQLYFLYEHPLNLNQASIGDLEEIQLLTDLQINDLILHRQRFGKLISIYELQSLKYWDMNTIQLVLPFIRVDDRLDNIHVTLKEALQQGKFEAFFRFQTIAENKKGYDDVSNSIYFVFVYLCY